MAPVEETYFPALEKCLASNNALISWPEAYVQLCSRQSLRRDSQIYRFLSSDAAVKLLSSSLQHADTPTPQSKSDFETKTAAINITPASHGQYDINQIKEDALWLSKEVNLNEVSALRVAVLEWQNRPKAKLRHGFTEAERSTLEAVLGLSGGRTVSFAGRELMTIPSREETDITPERFMSDERRRLRILDQYFSERQSVLAVHEFLLAGSFEAMGDDKKDLFDRRGRPDEGSNVLENLGGMLLNVQKQANPKLDTGRQVETCVRKLQAHVDSLASGSNIFKAQGGREDIEAAWTRTHLQEMITIMNIMFLHIRSARKLFSAPTLLEWFRFAAKYDFLERFEGNIDGQLNVIPTLRACVISVSLGILQIPAALSFLVDISGKTRGELEPHHLAVYFLDKSNLSELHDIMLNAAGNSIPVASPAVFAWGTLLFAIREVGLIAKEARETNQIQSGQVGTPPAGPQAGRRNSGSSIGSIQQSVYEDAFDAIRHLHQDDPIGFLISSGIEVGGANVFDIISTAAGMSGSKDSATAIEKILAFQELASASLDVVGYSPEVISCLLDLLNDAGSPLSQEARKSVQLAFVNDKILMDAIFDESLSRFPYESLPFLKLCTSLSFLRDESGAPLILSKLRTIGTFTQAVTPDFHGFHTIREDENANLVSLDQALGMHQLSSSLLLDRPYARSGFAEANDSSLIKAGTTGQVVSDSRPPVIMWYHEYQGLSFLGKTLDLIKRGEEVSFASQDGSHKAITATTIGLLATLVEACITSGDSNAAAPDTARSILEEAGDALERNEDIISLVFEIFDQELQNLRYRSSSERNLDILISCIDFFHCTVKILPGRIWPLLAQGSLLDLDGNGGLLASVVASIEASSGSFFFLQGCVRLYSALVDEAISIPTSGSASREVSSRSSAKYSMSSSAPLHVVGKVLLAFSMTMADVFETASEWRYMIPQQKADMNTCICSTFSKIIRYTYYVDDTPLVSRKLTSALASCAPSLMATLKPPSSTGTLANPLVKIIAGGLQLPDPYLDPNYFAARLLEIEASLQLSLTAVRAGRAASDPVVGFETHLGNSLPFLIRMAAKDERFVAPALDLIECLLSEDTSHTASSSLLGRLGPTSSQNFLSLLGRYDKPGADLDAYRATWRLLTALLSSRQQWFAVFILTGESPKDALIHRTKDAAKLGTGKSFLDSALQSLSQIEDLDPRAALPLLRFIAQAQENWPWVTTRFQEQSGDRTGFLASLYDYVSKIDLKPNKPLEQCYQIQVAATIADVLTVHFHQLHSRGDTAFLKKAISTIKWYTDHATAVTAYNGSLHSNLKKNLERKYSTCQLSNFQRTLAAPRELGEDYFYDIDIAKHTLRHDPTWIGDRTRGFEHEIKRANVNLSLVEAELALLRSWRALAVEHTSSFLGEPELQKSVISAANKCLLANTKPCPQEAIFDQVFQIRAEFALALLQRMNNAKITAPEMEDILSISWEAMRFRDAEFERALANDDLKYWRTMTEIMFLALQFQLRPNTDPSKPSPLKQKTLSIILEVLTVIVAQGFRGMASALHDDTVPPETVTAKDFGLILGILQTCLRIPSVPRITAEISEHIISTDVAKSAVLLFSWSHTLVAPGHDPDPIYGEVSLLFLVCLSTLPVLAEYLATSSILSQLSATHLAQILAHRQQAVSPFDTKSALSRRMYSIWSTGILPLSLNLLSHVGRNFAAEIAAFLDQFPTQLAHASSFLSTSTPISFTTLHEIFSLTLVSHIFEAYRLAGPSAGVDALEIPSLTSWDDTGRKELREDIEDMLERRVGLRKRLVPTSAKENSWLRAKPLGKEPGCETLLEENIVIELRNMLGILKGESGDGE